MCRSGYGSCCAVTVSVRVDPFQCVRAIRLSGYPHITRIACSMVPRWNLWISQQKEERAAGRYTDSPPVRHKQASETTYISVHTALIERRLRAAVHICMDDKF